MPALNFQERFADQVRAGLVDFISKDGKRQIIQPERKYPIKPGDTLYLYTGMRTKKCERLGKAVCRRTTLIHISTNNYIKKMDLGWRNIFYLDLFAVQNGFLDWPEMRNWFKKRYGLPFEGVLIEW